MSHGPIEQKHYDEMNAVAHMLSEVFKGYGFCLLVFEMDSNEGRMNYISNTQRKDMLVAMKEFIANNEGMGMDAPKGLQ